MLYSTQISFSFLKRLNILQSLMIIAHWKRVCVGACVCMGRWVHTCIFLTELKGFPDLAFYLASEMFMPCVPN